MDELVLLEAIENLEQQEIQAGERYRRFNRLCPFDNMSDNKFLQMFRLSKELARYLINMLQPFMRTPTRNTDLDISTKVK